MRQDHFHWFAGGSFLALQSKMALAGPNSRLEVHGEGPDMTLFVIDPDQPTALDGGGGGTNDVFICPPRCP